MSMVRSTQKGRPDALTDMVLSSEDEKARTGKSRSGRYFLLILMGAFILIMLFGLWMGTAAFRAVNAVQDGTDEARLALNSLANRVRASDSAQAFSVVERDDGKVMVFTVSLEAGDYETRIYQYDGYIVEELAFSTDPYIPEIATKIVQSDTFDFTYEQGLLTVTTDQGVVNVALRSTESLPSETEGGAR